MSSRCPFGFDQTLLSGLLDNELTQTSEQKTRVHLEDCAHCRALYSDLALLREATMTTRIQEPTDDQWDERPRDAFSQATRGLGWILAVIWLVTVSGFAIWQIWTGPQDLFEKLVVFGGLAAVVLLFVSVLTDRLRGLSSDRYREVQK